MLKLSFAFYYEQYRLLDVQRINYSQLVLLRDVTANPGSVFFFCQQLGLYFFRAGCIIDCDFSVYTI
jgi:hypothetical protein